MEIINLTIGAYHNKVPFTIGIGLEPGPACDKILDAIHLDNFYDEFSIGVIFSFDMIEHIPTKQIPTMLSSWFKVLVHGGRIEIGTVDLENICHQFLSSDLNGRKILLNHFYGSQSFISDFHQTGFTFEILKEYLEQAGFSIIHRFNSIYKSWSGTLVIEAFKT